MIAEKVFVVCYGKKETISHSHLFQMNYSRENFERGINYA